MATRRDPRLIGNWTAPIIKKPVIAQDPLAATTVINAVPGQQVATQPQAVRTITDPMAGIPAPQTVNNNIQPQQIQNKIPPITDPMAVNPVTTNESLVQNNIAPPVSTNGSQAGGTTQPQPSLFGNTAGGIGDAYTGTLRDALTGKIFDPMAAGTKEAMARAEANKRAAVAGQIAGAGFSGTGIGQQIAGGVENNLTRQRYDTMIGIEQARNEGRVNALGEARAYGTAEEGIRQYEKDFGEGARRFDTGQSNWERGFDEDKRRYDQNFAEDKERYGDTQEWKAYEEAMRNGSDADVISAYKAATGKDLDPAAVSQYRGYYRRGQEQGLEAGRVAIDTARQTLDTMKKTEAGNGLANYLATHLDSDMNDPALGPMMQKYWESLGNTGPVPQDWADQQIRAARDVRINTEIGAMNYQIDQLVASGQMKPEDAALLKDFNSGGWTQFLVRDPATGKPKFDANAYLASLSGETEDGTIEGQGGVKIKIPTDASGNPTKNNGDYFYGEDGNLYTVKDGVPTSASVGDIVAAKDWTRLLGLMSESPEMQEKFLKDIPVANYSLNVRTGTDKIKTDLRENDITKITFGGKEIAVKVNRIGKIDKSGFDYAFIEFVGSDGKYYYQSTGVNGKVEPMKEMSAPMAGSAVVGGNRNIE
jgi:hypothetical protein